MLHGDMEFRSTFVLCTMDKKDPPEDQSIWAIIEGYTIAIN